MPDNDDVEHIAIAIIKLMHNHGQTLEHPIQNAEQSMLD